ncbi:alpha/beta fold hydrolase [Macrococcus hajekii]|uniref:Alpha/beta fold hydrolase n=1 Tax=Macrococcus hajekii TaxID=198482 RepID=A0A4R6BKJ8_9STAP|nr:alpha/beta fold hydrolase [Macrococcus hajekii]TDM02121.1 alpha/beta fold hydrolase [Macrococcus hajekii]
MKLKNPSPIYLKGSDHAILLLHSFTGTVRDVKELAKRLNAEGFTTYVPSYPGHGLLLEDFLEYDTDDWWQVVVDSYEFLKSEGHKKVSAVGVSLGGLYTLKLLETYPEIEQGVIMSAPRSKDATSIDYRLEQYGMRLNKMLGMADHENERQLALIKNYSQGTEKFCSMIEHLMGNLDKIKSPVLVMYGERDDKSYAESAQFIHEQLTSQKQLVSLASAGHLMTLGRGQASTEKYIISYFCHKDV